MPEPPPQPQTGYPPAPVNLGQGAGGFIIPPIPPAFGGPMPPVVPPGPYPAGFFPQGGPQVPVIPGIDRSPVHSPVIPHAPPGWDMDMPEASQYVGPRGPVLPSGAPFGEYHPTGPSEYVHHIGEPDDERVIPTTPSSRSSSPLQVPGRSTVFIPPTPGHDSSSSTFTQESYHPPFSPGGLPIPSGDVPHVIPVDHSMGGPRHTPPPHQTIINVPQTAFPPPGHIIEPGIPVQPSITLQQPGMPMYPGGVAIPPSMQGVQPGPIVIHPPMSGYPVPVSESVYVPSRASSRTSARPPVVVIQSSLDRSPVQMPTSMVGVPASIHLHDDHVRRSPTIPGLPSSAGPPIIIGQTTGGSRPYSPEGRHHRGSPSRRDYSPRDEGHRLRRRRHPDDRRRSYSYSPDGGYRGRYYSPGYEADPRYRYRRPYSPSDRGYRRYGDDDYSPERRRRGRYDDDGHSPERRRRGRDDDDDHSPGRRRRGRYGDYEDDPGDRQRRRGRDDRDHPERGDGEHSPEDPGRPSGRRRRRDDRDHPDDEEHSPEDPGRGAPRRHPSGRSAPHPDVEEHDAGDRPRAQPSDARSARGPGFGEGDTTGALPHPAPPPASPPPPTIIRLGGEPRTRKSLRFPMLLSC
jgi:hypothetical protein